jgi:hypothetical protein
MPRIPNVTQAIEKSKEIETGNQCAPKSLLKKLQNNPESEINKRQYAAYFNRSFETQIDHISDSDASRGQIYHCGTAPP